MMSKAKDLDAMFKRKTVATVKKIEDLHCLLILKETDVLGDARSWAWLLRTRKARPKTRVTRSAVRRV